MLYTTGVLLVYVCLWGSCRNIERVIPDWVDSFAAEKKRHTYWRGRRGAGESRLWGSRVTEGLVWSVAQSRCENVYIQSSRSKLIEGASGVGGGQEISTPNSILRSGSVCSPCESQSGSGCVSGPILRGVVSPVVTVIIVPSDPWLLFGP